MSSHIIYIISHSGRPNGGVPQGTLPRSKCFLVYINDLKAPVPLYKYVDDSTLFEICDRKCVSVIQESKLYENQFKKIKRNDHQIY